MNHRLTALRRSGVALLATFALAAPTSVIVAMTAPTAQAAPAGVTVSFQSNSQRVPIRVGEEAMVAVSTGSPTRALAYQWLRDGALIPHATSSRYMVVGEDFGSIISVRLTLTTDALATTTFTEVAGKPLEGLVRVSAPVVTGEHVAGGTVAVDVGTLAPGSTSSFVWLLTQGGESATIGTGTGTSSSLQIPASAVGGQLQVNWRLERLGYQTVELSSSSTVVGAGVSAPQPEPAPVTPAPVTPTPDSSAPGAGEPTPVTPVEGPTEGPGVGSSPEPSAHPSGQPAAQAPMLKMVAKAPNKVKQGKKFTLTVSQASGKVSAKASHQKRAKGIRVVRSKGTLKIAAPKLPRGIKARTISVKVVMKSAGGAIQTRTVKVRVVR